MDLQIQCRNHEPWRDVEESEVQGKLKEQTVLAHEIEYCSGKCTEAATGRRSPAPNSRYHGRLLVVYLGTLRMKLLMRLR